MENNEKVFHLQEELLETNSRKSDRRENGRNNAKTFRRGRALAFYQKLVVKRDTLKKQLGSKELQSIHSVIAGELKATEAIMADFKEAFDLDEVTAELHVE